MKSMQDAKAVYDTIALPDELGEAVRDAVRSTRGPRSAHVARWSMIAAAAMCTVFVVLVNASPVLANNLYEVPVIGNVARVFTFTQYEKTEEADVLKVNLPALENTGNSDLERRINYEIQYKMNQLVEEARHRARAYKQAFLETGGQEEDFLPTEIYVDYTLYCNDGQTVSFVIDKAETAASFYGEQYFYNIDLESGRNLTLKDMLGPHYVRLINDSVRRQMEERMAADDSLYYYKDEEGAFTSIRDDQPFYINAQGRVVVVFEKYEIAPGYMGIQEFEVLPEA